MSSSPIIPTLDSSLLATNTSSLAWAQTTNLVHIPSGSALLFDEIEWLRPNSQSDTSLVERVRRNEGDGEATAPAGASRYTAREFNFPTGSLRVMTWHTNPVLHQITFETQLYMLKGWATVSVAGEEVVVNAGDVVFQPSGILRNLESDVETVALSFFVSSMVATPKAKFVRGGTLDTVPTEDAIRSNVKQYLGDGNAIRHVSIEAGRTPEAANGLVDTLVYVISGRMKRVEGGAEYFVNAGDAIRQVANKNGYWDILEPSEFIATDMPFAPSKPRYKLQRGQAVSPETACNLAQCGSKETRQ